MRYGRELPGYPFNAKAFLTRCLIVAQRKFHGRLLACFTDFGKPQLDWDAEQTQEGIAEIIREGKPAMVARFGSGELEATLRGLAIQERRAHGLAHAAVRLLAGRSAPFWWDNSIRAGLCWVAGYFPPTDADLDRFAERIFQDCSELDVLATWQEGENRMRKRFFPMAKTCHFNGYSFPTLWANPWYKALEGKTVLIVHPFEKTIRRQYENREHLFPAGRELPSFELKVFRPFVTFGGHQDDCPFPTWLAALDHMIEGISNIRFDVAIIGAGAYGMSLAAAVKRMGKIGLHMGGATQLLFGIKGKRWDNYASVRHLYNSFWCRPAPEETPGNSTNIECGGYW